MDPNVSPDLIAALREPAGRQSGLCLLLLFGSRARGDAYEGSDWDFGFLADPGLEAFDPDRLLADLASALGTERIDLADLSRAGALVRFRAARDGIVIYDRDGTAHPRFWNDAVGFWCDAGPVIQSGYEGILERLDR